VRPYMKPHPTYCNMKNGPFGLLTLRPDWVEKDWKMGERISIHRGQTSFFTISGSLNWLG
jgi:hypothetical protein